VLLVGLRQLRLRILHAQLFYVWPSSELIHSTPLMPSVNYMSKYNLDVKFHLSGPIWEWRGPAPFYFVSISPEISAQIKADARATSYGWGAIPVRLTSNDHLWTTSIFTREGQYIVPIKKAIREALEVREGDVVQLTVELNT